jgi:hypothetical protein
MWENDIKKSVKEMGFEGVGWVQLAENAVQ